MADNATAGGAGTILTGGCLCGRCRFRLRSADLAAKWCHCSMCRKATGNPAWLFLTVPLADFAWLTEPPRVFASSRIAERGFCPDCGSPLTFRLHAQDSIDVSVGCLDTPGRVRPVRHYGIEGRCASLAVHDGLPAERSEDSADLVAAWQAAYGADVRIGPRFQPDAVDEDGGS